MSACIVVYGNWKQTVAVRGRLFTSAKLPLVKNSVDNPLRVFKLSCKLSLTLQMF